MVSNIRNSIREMRKDYLHGSSWYFEQISHLLSRTGEEELKALRRALPSIRPGMASILNIQELLTRENFSSATSANTLGLALVKYKERSEARLKTHLKLKRIHSVISISYSGAVKMALKEGEIDMMFLLRSEPGREWKKAVDEYGKFCDVKLIPDSVMSSAIKEVDAVILGYDGLHSSGHFVNKIGSYPLCLSAKETRKPVIAIGESFKTSILPPKDLLQKKISAGGRTITVPLFEAVPNSLLTTLITDLGTIEGPSGTDVDELHRRFNSEILELIDSCSPDRKQ